MKTFLAITLTAMMLWGCSSSSEGKKEEELKQAIEQAQQSGIIETDLFLGFKFGMTEKDVENHFDQLVKEEKVYLTSTRKYQYDYDTESGFTYELSFIPSFHDGKLYKMTYPIAGSVLPSSGDYIFLASDFTRSDRREGFRMFITKDYFGETMYTHIKDNLIVEFNGTARPVMKYTNAPVEKQAKEKEALENKEKAANSSSEF